MGFKSKDITGLRFNRLVAVEKTPKKTTSSESIWTFICDCGNCKDVPVSRVTGGKTKSCGCYAKEVTSERSKTHGLSHTPPHNSWLAMVQRCSDPADPHKAKYYGDVEIQTNWLTDFSAFYAHIGEQPQDDKKYSIERIKNSLGYVEGNVRWADGFEQARNRGLQEKSQTGVNGVTLAKQNRRGYDELAYVATTYNLDGTKKSKRFSVRKYGLLPALALACKARNTMIDALNEQGAGYSAEHGK